MGIVGGLLYLLEAGEDPTSIQIIDFISRYDRMLVLVI